MTTIIKLIVSVLINKRDRENILGDLEERYEANKVKFGEKEASRLLRNDTLKNLWPYAVIRAYQIYQFTKIILNFFGWLANKLL